MSAPLVVAISGASGVIYATRLLEVLRSAGRDVELTISPPAALVLQQELRLEVQLHKFHIDQLLPPDTQSTFDLCPATREDRRPLAQAAADLPPPLTDTKPAADGAIRYHFHADFMSALASGSARTAGMVVCPCSGSTLSALVTGASGNLIHRAMDVHLKERRPLILVPRETPLSLVALDNMRRAAELGAVVLPAMPGWYHGVQSARDLVDFVVGRILDQLRIDHSLVRRWGP